ncbi:hypothetical protein [Moraxella equi]|uniref:Uncharacterized protein n=1 Tax=Moraxella equi TaxID=60442 RepID=A0A378QW45_9GAMM|nr:hypothetical protein [Moraxella equi]STZ03663.1 Uncharacterised protein [Moraxella equi]
MQIFMLFYADIFAILQYLNKKWKVRAALHKDNTQTSGIGFRIDD